MIRTTIAAILFAAASPALASWDVQRLSPGNCMAVAQYNNGVRVGLYATAEGDDVGLAVLDAKVDRRALYPLVVRPGAGAAFRVVGSAETGVIIAEKIQPQDFLRMIRAGSVSITGFGVFNFSDAQDAVRKVVECTTR